MRFGGTLCLFSLSLCFFLFPEKSSCQVNLNKGLIAYYPFNGNANDATGNGNDGVIVGNVQPASDRNGNPNSAFHFDGVNSYISVNDNGKLSPNSITIAALVNTQTTASQVIAGKIDYTTGYAATYYLGINYDIQTGYFFGSNANISGTCFQQYPYNPSAPYAKSGQTIIPNTWHCVVGMFDGSAEKIYVDGVLADSNNSTVSTMLQCPNTQFRIGSWWVGDKEPFNGTIDEVRVYNRALNSSEVAALCSLSNCPSLQGTLTGSNICPGDAQGFLTFHSPDSTGPFMLTYTDGTDSYTQPNVADSVPFAVQLTPKSTATYTLLSILDTTNCPVSQITGGSTDSIVVLKPSITAFPDTTVCPGSSAPLRASGALSYSWSPATGLSDPAIANPIATPATTTSYIVQGLSPDGCLAKDTIVVSLFPPTNLILTADTAICLGDPAPLQAAGGASYAWSPTQYLDNPAIADPVARPVKTTRFFLQAYDINHCNELDSVNVSIRPAPVFQAPPDEKICTGYTVRLTGKNPVTDLYNWSPAGSLDDPSSPDPIAGPAATTIYTLSISDPVCNLYDSTFKVTVDVLANPTVTAQKANDIDCTVTTARLNARGAVSYEWSPAAGLSDPQVSDPLASIDSTTTFIVRGTADNGCVAFDTLTVKVTTTGKDLFVVPGAFSPNGDGHNDCFGIQRWGDVTIEEFSIFDRWGVRVFTTRNPSECWDGNFRGKPQASGAYPYVIKARSFCGEITRTGVIMLVR